MRSVSVMLVNYLSIRQTIIPKPEFYAIRLCTPCSIPYNTNCTLTHMPFLLTHSSCDFHHLLISLRSTCSKRTARTRRRPVRTAISARRTSRTRPPRCWCPPTMRSRRRRQRWPAWAAALASYSSTRIWLDHRRYWAPPIRSCTRQTITICKTVITTKTVLYPAR